jgi:hypothetical protein
MGSKLRHNLGGRYRTYNGLLALQFRSPELARSRFARIGYLENDWPKSDILGQVRFGVKGRNTR